AEIGELGKLVREAISKLPQKDRVIVEYRFYRNMQVKDIAKQVGLDPFKDTSGPSLNILIKLMSMVSIVMAMLTVAIH
ncbi:MAG: sodium/proton-translocating pyrophosphatase, partial [Bacteroidales bacterium]|nr:sodium/proton-translocating pyrophosphatase [Bacteroidales bacterium]